MARRITFRPAAAQPTGTAPQEQPSTFIHRLLPYRWLLLAVAGLLLAVGVGVVWRQHSRQQAEVAAQEALWQAQRYHEQGEYTKALTGDSVSLGLLDVIGNFPGTKGAQLAHFYAAQIYLQQRKLAQALQQLSHCDFGDKLLQPRVWALRGDIHCEAQRYEQALECYQQASALGEKAFDVAAYVMKEALVHEELGDYALALACYRRVVQQLKASPKHYRQAQKHLGRLTLMLQQQVTQ